MFTAYPVQKKKRYVPNVETRKAWSLSKGYAYSFLM